AGAGILSAIIFYAYPFVKIKDRRRSITTNLPFAINHISSVAASGVPPSKMFELISVSKEYGEVAVEIKKIVDFINIFGYDFLTAVKAVAASTPSPVFKEFLEGMVSNIETGGDLDKYLQQKADEATLNYQLERQRYNETVGTYSDIYTGLLIAAPLFFVAALALVNLLGGTIGGISVDVVMALGAYLAIPVINIIFLMFLQFNQPEV
ncbi:type II secretion system F family protein, partial [Candidatus Woesearchaeota archaeon]|nr:type II secretion system F family protein [Candidatus Woesearchaeota archaeon]